MGRHICGKNLQRAPNQVHGTIGVPACPAAGNFGQPAIKPWHETDVSLAAGESGQIVSDSREPEDARAALSGTLVGQVAGDTRRLGNSARVGSENDDDPHAGRGTDRPEGDGSIGSAEVFGTDPGPPIATDKKRLGRRDRSAQHGNLTKGHAPVDLDHSGQRYPSSDRDETCSRLLCHSASTKRRRSVPGDERDVRQRLRVVDERGALLDAECAALVGSEHWQ
jgi:hypothetical protein